MDGFEWLIKNALQAAGVKIDPAEITKTVETAKILIPKIAEDFQRIEASQKRVEEKLDFLLRELAAPSNDAIQSLSSDAIDPEVTAELSNGVVKHA